MTYLLLYFLLQGPQGPPGGVGPMGSVGEKVRVINWHLVFCLFSETLAAATYSWPLQIAQPPPCVTTCSLIISYNLAFCLS